MYLMIGSQLGHMRMLGDNRANCSASPILVIYLVPVPRGIDNVESEANTIFDDD